MNNRDLREPTGPPQKVADPSSTARPHSRRKFFGTITRRERWGLSWRGWLSIIFASLIGGYVILVCAYPWLSVTEPVDTKVLVVEGWIHEYAIRIAVDEFNRGGYERVFTTGGPVQGSGGYINDYNTAASVGADLLKKWGIPAESLQMVPSRVMDRDRTYGSAVALRNWLQQHELRARSMNVVTEDVHARRTRLLFQKALGPQIKVGIIGITNPDYDAKHWWQYSEGRKEVTSEALALLYAELLFHPTAEETALP